MPYKAVKDFNFLLSLVHIPNFWECYNGALKSAGLQKGLSSQFLYILHWRQSEKFKNKTAKDVHTCIQKTEKSIVKCMTNAWQMHMEIGGA